MNRYIKEQVQYTGRVQQLLQHEGAGINTSSNEFKESALTLACYKGHMEMVEYLLLCGADQDHKTDEVGTVYFFFWGKFFILFSGKYCTSYLASEASRYKCTQWVRATSYWETVLHVRQVTDIQTLSKPTSSNWVLCTMVCLLEEENCIATTKIFEWNTSKSPTALDKKKYYVGLIRTTRLTRWWHYIQR